MDEVMITGIGSHTSIGRDTSELWESLLAGKCGTEPLTLFDVSSHTNKMACQIHHLPAPEQQGLLDGGGRTIGIFMPAIEEALRSAGLSIADLSRYRVGLCVGTTMGEIEPLEQALRGANPAVQGGPSRIAAHTAAKLGLQGPLWTFTNACSAGNFAIAKSMDELRFGRADIMIAGGVDSLSWVAFTGFSSLRAMSPDRCRPFDVNRQGLILGEGAGVLVLETRAHAQKRGASERAQLLGYGLGCDAHHITQPDPEAKGAVRAMRQAMSAAGVLPHEVTHVSAHGTGTMANDRMEAKAIIEVFMDKDRDERLTVNSIKGHIGHTLGAASAIEAVMCVKTIETSAFPPTANTKHIDPICRHEQLSINRQVQEGRVGIVMSNSYAFGGINSSIVLAAPERRTTG